MGVCDWAMHDYAAKLVNEGEVKACSAGEMNGGAVLTRTSAGVRRRPKGTWRTVKYKAKLLTTRRLILPMARTKSPSALEIAGTALSSTRFSTLSHAGGFALHLNCIMPRGSAGMPSYIAVRSRRLSRVAQRNNSTALMTPVRLRCAGSRRLKTLGLVEYARHAAVCTARRPATTGDGSPEILICGRAPVHQLWRMKARRLSRASA